MRFLIIPQTPVIQGLASKEAIPRGVTVNGQYRRQNAMPDPIPFSDEMCRAMSLAHAGAVQFVNDISDMMSRMTVQRIQKERDRFRGILPVSSRPPEPELPDVSDAV